LLTIKKKNIVNAKIIVAIPLPPPRVKLTENGGKTEKNKVEKKKRMRLKTGS
jgi:hypothetical protein